MDAAHRLKAARDQVAKALGAEPDRVFFTSGGTEADNWAIFSAMSRMGKRGRHVITTAVEHHAVLNPMRRLEEQGFEVTYLKPDALGRVCLDALREAIRPDTVLVSVMMVNNESGAVMPIGAMAKLTHRLAPNAIFHTDAVQGFLKLPFQAKTLGADLISISSHKVHGPKGAGALYIRRGLPLPPYLLGGGQEGATAVVRRQRRQWPALEPPVLRHSPPFGRIWPGRSPSGIGVLRCWRKFPGWSFWAPGKRPTFCWPPYLACQHKTPSTCCRTMESVSLPDLPAPGATEATYWRLWACRRRRWMARSGSPSAALPAPRSWSSWQSASRQWCSGCGDNVKGAHTVRPFYNICALAGLPIEET